MHDEVPCSLEPHMKFYLVSFSLFFSNYIFCKCAISDNYIFQETNYNICKEKKEKKERREEDGNVQ